MAKTKSKINEKLTTTYKVDAEGVLNVDNLQENELIIEVEDTGEVDLFKYLKKFNGKYVKITITEKNEEVPEE